MNYKFKLQNYQEFYKEMFYNVTISISVKNWKKIRYINKVISIIIIQIKLNKLIL